MKFKEVKTIDTSECEFCEYGSIDETDKARVTVYCSKKDKTYCFGQRIQCDG